MEGYETSAEMRVMPRDEAAELALISAMMFDNEALVQGAEFVRPEDFYRLDYRLVFAALLDLYNTGQPVDLITLKNKLQERESFEKAGGNEALAAIAAAVSTSVNVKQYIKIVMDKSVLRKLISYAGEVSTDSFAAIKATDIILDNAEGALFSIGQKRHSIGFVHVHEALMASMAVIEKAYED